MQSPLPAKVRRLGMWCHLAGLAWLSLFVLPIPYLWLLAPYLVWKLNRAEHPFVDEQGKESLSFQISIAVYLTALLILALFLLLATCGVIFGGIVFHSTEVLNILTALAGPIAIGIGLVILVGPTLLVIVAARKALNGQSYRYPLNLRFFG